jgi:hypothetical protein
LGIVAGRRGDPLAARSLQEALAIRRELGDRWGIAASLNNLADVAHDQRDYSAARALSEESLQIYRQVGERRGNADVLSHHNPLPNANRLTARPSIRQRAAARAPSLRILACAGPKHPRIRKFQVIPKTW